MVVKRLYDNLSTLRERKKRGYRVGRLRWKPPREYRSLTYNQTGFKLENKSGQPTLWLSKIGNIPIVLHREIPDDATVKQVSIKREPTGEWYAVLGIKTADEAPPKPKNPEKAVGIDVGILKYTHDTDGLSMGSLDLSDERERLEREQRALSRKEHGSANYHKQRRKVAECHADLKRKRRDFLHKLSTWYAKEYDFVAVEALNAKGLMELPSNSRNRTSAAWGTFLRMLEYKCEREGAYFVDVRPHGTTKECSQCGVSTDKPLWVREHSCPACGFECDRDANAAHNVLNRSIEKSDIGMGQPESTSSETLRVSDVRTRASLSLTPVETGAATDAEIPSVSARTVVEAGSPTLNEVVRDGEAIS